jgi:hypothetical protein
MKGALTKRKFLRFSKILEETNIWVNPHTERIKNKKIITIEIYFFL